ncbi:MAG: 2'-deoxycytidine 5'-triphosphate deaminase, partial [Chloroflexi bacterium]|nr:2'-deoxycytidine 5'-triphosphate deaminase [Chloroflexota bacterium]
MATTAAVPRTASAEQPATGPGVYSSRMLREAINAGRISPKRIPAAQIQPASIDLRLGAKAYRLRSSFLPGPTARVRDRLPELQMGAPLDLADPEGVVFEPGRPYLVRLMESVRLPEGTVGRTNPRSSTGRLDVFTRVISDRGTQFDEIEPGYEGPLWLEVYSNTFTVNARQGLALTQLRISSGDSWLDAAAVGELHAREGLVFERGRSGSAPRERVEAPRIGQRGLLVSVDLPGGQFCGWRAKRNSALLDLARTEADAPVAFGAPVYAEPGGRLGLRPGDGRR